MTVTATSQTVFPSASVAVPLEPVSTQAGATGSTFSSVLDAINPLQHIPVVSHLFRAASGSSISPVSQLAGDTLYGGVIGGAVSAFVSSLADIAVKGVTGKDIGEHVIATVEGGTSSATPLVATPSLTPAQTTQEEDTTLKDKADAAAALILRTGSHPEKIAGQYKRAQALDATNRILASI